MDPRIPVFTAVRAHVSCWREYCYPGLNPYLEE